MHQIKPEKHQQPGQQTDLKIDQWDACFIKKTPLFWPIAPVFHQLETNDKTWPTLNDYNQLISGHIINENQKNITFVDQESQCPTFEDEYEPRIFLSGEVQTRLNNWHDFFQVMVWKTFPKTKSLLNEIHHDAAVLRRKSNKKQRSKQENFVTLFDECGTIVLSTNKKALAQIKNFEWNEFFIKNKSEFGKTIDCAVFGHAMYEKALNPYIGMTSHCLLLQVSTEYFELATSEKVKYIDDLTLNYIKEINDLNTKTLTPLPILGVPGWYHDQSNDFYGNQSYFRPGRKG